MADKEVSIRFADGLIDRRMFYGWTQTDLAKKTGLTSAAISLLEKEKRSPNLETLLKLANAFGISVFNLVFEGNNKSTKELVFYAKFGSIDLLSKDDQILVLSLANRLGVKR